MKQWVTLGLVALTLNLMAGENFVRNGNFMRLGNWNDRKVDGHSTPYADWRWSGKGKAPAETLGKIELTAPGTLLCGSPAPATPAREYVLTFEVKTKGAKGNAYLEIEGRTLTEKEKPAPEDTPWSYGDFIAGARKGTPAKYAKTNATSPRLKLPENTNGKFVTLSTHTAFKINEPLPAKVFVKCWLDLISGSCTLRDVRIEADKASPDFHPARDEWLTVSVNDVPIEKLASFAYSRERTFKVTNTSEAPLSGTLTFALDTWRTPGQGKALKNTKELDGLKAGESVEFVLNPVKLPPDAYVATATLINNGEKIVKVSDEPLPLGQKVLTKGYNILCFAVYPDVKPAKIFGIGNSMLCSRLPDDVELARELGVVSVWYKGFVGAAFGATSLDSETIDQYPPIFHKELFGVDPKLAQCLNPLRRSSLDIFTPKARAEIARRGEIYGKERREFPGIYALRINNEKAYFNRNAHCPSEAADANFREWCKKRHGSLENLNRHWGTNYKSWDEVDQVISAKMIDLAKKSYKEKIGAAAIDWKASSTFLNGEGYEKQLRKNWGQTMDWMRWTTDSTLWLYDTFIKNARKYDSNTVYSNCFCWPCFWPAVVIPHFRSADSAQLDVQYCAGFDGGARHDRHLGNNDEMFDILEMTESVIPSKPIIGNEVYVQPAYDDDYPALQNWGLVAHGMSNILTFGWKKFSDHGYKVFYDEKNKKPRTRYWEDPESIACWMLFDTDGTKLPIYDSVKKSSREIAGFHKKYDFWSTKRLPSRIGWYLSNDSSELVVPISANRPWDNPIMTSRFTLSSFLRRYGVTMDYLDDEDLKRMTPKNFDTIIVPPAPVLSDNAAKALADFTKAGGKLIVVGPTGVYDPWLNLNSYFGGKAWDEINGSWNVPVRWKNPDVLMKDMLAYPVHNGSALAPLSAKLKAEKKKFAEKQLMTMPETALPNGKTIGDFGKCLPWGKGEIIVVSTFPERRTQMPYAPPALRAYMKQFIQKTGLPRNGYFQLDGEMPSDNHKNLLGRGMPEVEVVVREKDNGDRFVFVLNCGGDGSGKVILPGMKGQVVDAINNEEKVPFKAVNNGLEIPVDLSSWGYRVLKVSEK